MSADPHKPLRENVRLLGEQLGEVLRAHEGDALFQQVERVRALAKRARAGSDPDFEMLARELSQLSVDSALPLARAFAHFLHLPNIAEHHHRIPGAASPAATRRRRRSRDPARMASRG